MLGIFITAGHPNIDKSVRALEVLDEAQVDLIELGVPFSDPLADGPTIQESSHQAIENGVNIDTIFEIIQKARKTSKNKTETGLNNLILFSYYNPLNAYGFEKLADECLKNNVKGVLIPDLPMDEAKEIAELFHHKNLHLVLLAAPTTTKDRAKMICELSSPFVYLVSRTGITGGSEDISHNAKLKELITELKGYSQRPVALGFGIDSPEKVKEARGLGADMAIIGSKTVKVLAADQSPNLDDFAKFIKSVHEASK